MGQRCATAPPPELRAKVRAFDKATLTVHYYRYDQDYSGWNLWVWHGNEPGREVGFTAADAFGVVGRVEFSQITDAEEVGFVIRRSVGGNPWAEKDGEGDRLFPSIIWMVRETSTYGSCRTMPGCTYPRGTWTGPRRSSVLRSMKSRLSPWK